MPTHLTVFNCIYSICVSYEKNRNIYLEKINLVNDKHPNEGYHPNNPFERLNTNANAAATIFGNSPLKCLRKST